MLPRIAVPFALLSLCFACNNEKKAEPQAAATEPVQSAAPAAAPAAAAPLTGAQVFKTRCVVCHGESGKGDGVGAAALTVKPRNYTDPAWQKSVTDDQIRTIIVKGGAAVGKDPGMPPNPDLATNASAVDELVKIVRGFAAAQ